MTQRIIITSNETIVCPKCVHHFPLDQGITRQTIERYEAEFDKAFAEQRKILEVYIYICFFFGICISISYRGIMLSYRRLNEIWFKFV